MIAEQLVCGYGEVTVVRPLDLEVRAGEVLALLGPNGAGKTTLLSTLAGILPRLGGRVSVEGRPVLVPDDRSLFPNLTTAENIEVARPRRRRGTPARAMLDHFPALEARWNVAAGNLSGGEQQMLALARALVQQPTVLLVDELSLGLAPVVVESLLPIVRRVADDMGAAVVVVEQHVQFALRMADRALVLVHGEVRLHDAAAALARRPADLEAAYLGPRSMEEDT